MDDPLKPALEGLVESDTVLDENGFIDKYELKTGNAKALAELLDDYAFFTPAALYLHGRFRDAPLADFIYMVAPDCRFYYKKFRHQIFRGLETKNRDPDWNYVLWAVERRHMEQFSAWMVSLTLTYEDDKSVAGVGEQQFQIVDPLAAERASMWHPGLGTVPVTTFGLNGSRFKAGFVAGESKLLDPPTLGFFVPDAEMREFRKALYGGANPVDARALHRQQTSRKEDGREDQTGNRT